ncbi:radical SAM protein [Acidobacteria bacterium AB60]|nr:radical SAM protein [Acidobacteria bacterium AB60]
MAKTAELFPIIPLHRRIGTLARAADNAPLESTGCLTEYRPIEVRSICSKTTSRRGLPFTHAINPYRGCEFACRYCYARYTHEFLERTPEDFEHKIFYKQNASWLLKQELARLKPGTEIALGTATDPYQPLERKQRITRSILEVFSQTRGFALGIVTKSALIARDVELLQEVGRRHRLTIHLTVTTMKTDLARILEPRAPRPDLRMHTLSRLRSAGLRAGILCSPLMPGITDSRSSIAAVGRAAAEAGASFMAAGALFLKPCSLPTFFQFVKEHFPAQLPAYEKRYKESAFVSPEYRKRVAEIVDSVCREYKLGRRYEEMPPAKAMPEPRVELQPWLPFAS